MTKLIKSNIASVVDASFYKGCINKEKKEIEIYRSKEHGFLVCVDNVIIHFSKSRRDALVHYGRFFEED